jgi:hypothetical protein
MNKKQKKEPSADDVLAALLKMKPLAGQAAAGRTSEL